MVDQILPSNVTVVETHKDCVPIELFPTEAAMVRNVVNPRRQEFTTVPACARGAFAALGLAPTDHEWKHGEPRWPSGIVGSMTHCVGYRGCAIAWSDDVLAIGIDAEPHAARSSDCPCSDSLPVRDIAAPYGCSRPTRSAR